MTNPIYRRIATAFTVLLASTASVATSYLEPFEFDCANQLDDDEDGLIDLADFDCSQARPPGCGDGLVVQGDGEVCDDFNNASADGCRADCRGFEVCGDGLTDPSNGEICDGADDAACSLDCSTISATSFLSEDDINGLNLLGASTAVFGEAVVTRPSGNTSLLVVVASSDAQLCDSIAAAAGLDEDGSTIIGFEAFFADLIAGRILAPVAIITAERPGATASFSAPAALQSDGVSLLIDGGFVVGDGATPLVDTLFAGGLDGFLSLQSISPTEIAGQYDGLQDFEFVNNVELNTGLRGIFVGTQCQALSDGLQSVFGQ